MNYRSGLKKVFLGAGIFGSLFSFYGCGLFESAEKIQDKVYRQEYNRAMAKCGDTNKDGIITDKEIKDFSLRLFRDMWLTVVVGSERPTINDTGVKAPSGMLIDRIREICPK